MRLVTGPTHPALAGLHDVPWSELEHAYGKASDVPALLEELTRGPEEREHALHELYGSIWHQGTVYEATAHAVPFLAALAGQDPSLARAELLELLGSIATGSSYLDVHGHLLRDGLSDDDRRQMTEELAHVAAARRAVEAELPRLVKAVMADPADAHLVAVARLAAAFPDIEEPFDEALDWMWDNAQDTRVRAALGIALARRGADPGFCDEILSDLCVALIDEGRGAG